MRKSNQATSGALCMALFGLVLTTLGVWWFAGRMAAIIYAGIYVASGVIAAWGAPTLQQIGETGPIENGGGVVSLVGLSVLINTGGLIALWMLYGGKAALIVIGARVVQSFFEGMGKNGS